MGFETNTVSGRNRAEYLNDNLINLGQFPAKAAYPKGTVVKLGADGKLDAALVAGDVPFGVVFTPCKKAEDYPVVVTGLSAVAVAKADGAVAIGALVYVSGFDTTGGITKVKTATTELINGIVLEAGANGAEVRVGYFITPFKK